MQKLYWILIVFAGLLGACQEEETPAFTSGAGGLDLKSPSADTETEIPVILTKGIRFDMNPATFPIVISDQNGNAYKTFSSYAAMREEGTPLVLPVGKYTIRASSFTPAARVSESPYFEDTQAFAIEEKTITHVSLCCRFESLGFELILADGLADLLKKEPANYAYSVSVSNGVTTWTFDATHTKPVYFLDPCKELTVKINVKLAGSVYPERTYRFTGTGGAQPVLGEYYQLTLDAGKNKLKLQSQQLENRD